MRFFSGQRGSCRPATGTEGLDVQVKDVSVSGIGLLAPRRFEKGTLMFLKLGTDSSRLVSVLVRVVRLVPQGDGCWLIGCAFVGEASEEEVLACREVAPQASRPGAAPLDRRAWLRLPCYVLTVCRPGLADVCGRWAVEVRDFSAGGLGLIVPGELQEANELRVALPALDGSPREVRVRVRRRNLLGNGKWLLGCEFCPDPSGEGTAAREAGAAGRTTPAPEREHSRGVRPRPARKPGSSKLLRVLSGLTTQVLAQHRIWEQELAEHPERLAELEVRARQAFSELANQVVAGLRAQAGGPASQPSSNQRRPA